MTMTEVPQRVVPLTDAKGRVIDEDSVYEPLPDSVVLVEGMHGCAWQRHMSDGLWHSTAGGQPQEWGYLLRQCNLVLIYDAPERES